MQLATLWADGFGLKVPWGHCAHDACAASAEYVPGTQLVHVAAFGGDDVPAGQAWHAVCPATAVKYPPRHGVHAADAFDPEALLNVPAGQRAHAAWPKSGLNEPGRQLEHDREDEMLGLNVPGGQREQFIEEVEPTLSGFIPPGQGWQDACPAAEAYVPAAHKTHTADELAVV